MRNKIKKYLSQFTLFSQFVNFLQAYQNYILDERDIWRGNINALYVKNAILVFVVRCNERISDNTAIRNNDLLVIVEYVSEDNFNLFTFNVTADPKAKNYNIAHLSEQIYKGNIRPHRWILGRLAICSDKGCWYKRTNTKGEVIGEYKGQIGINIHDTGGLWNSSLGCVILESLSEYRTVFKPLLQRVFNKNNIPVCVINQDYLTDELKI